MNSTEAKEVLLAYRPGTSDEADPEVQQALELARGDAELQHWLDQHLDFQKSVRRELRAIPIPSGLKARLLTQQKIVVVPLWKRSEFLLAAACLVVGLIVSALWINRPRESHSYAAFRARMVGFAAREYSMDIVTNDLVAISQKLRSNGSPADYVLRPPLKAMPAVGGKSMTWQGHPVSMVCFGLPKNQTLFMFVTEEASVTEGKLPGPGAMVESVGGMTTATWTDAGKLYVAAAYDSDPIQKLSQGLMP